MGRNANGVRGGRNSTSSKSGSRGATEKGYTDKMVRNIVGIEQKYRINKDETLHVFTSTGDMVRSIGGKGAQVRFNVSDIPQNSILTHNHPRSLGAKGIMRIGNSFSDDDIVSAVRTNAKEMRAVTPTYTFSVKRPSGGWGCSPQEVKKAYKAAERYVKRQSSYYFSKVGMNYTSQSRDAATFYHKVMKRVSAKFGWEYSKKNS